MCLLLERAFPEKMRMFCVVLLKWAFFLSLCVLLSGLKGAVHSFVCYEGEGAHTVCHKGGGGGYIFIWHDEEGVHLCLAR